jgi:hypothetical protein
VISASTGATSTVLAGVAGSHDYSQPTWSPDGSTIGVTDMVPTTPRQSTIDVFRAAGGAPTALTTVTTAGQQDSAADWSPDGSKLLFSRQTASGVVLETIPGGGGQPTAVPANGDSWTDPGFSPDGARLVATGHVKSVDIWTLDPTSGPVAQLTNVDNAGHADWGTQQAQPLGLPLATPASTSASIFYPPDQTGAKSAACTSIAGLSAASSCVEVIYTQVTGAGYTTLTTSATGPPAASGFSLGNSPTYDNVYTTAQFTTARVCVYDTSVTATSVLLQFDSTGHATDVTDYNFPAPPNPDPGARICSIPLSSLSLFAIAQPHAAPPTATIASPADIQTYTLGQAVGTSFSCTEGAGGPGIQSCLDSNGSTSPGSLDTSTAGAHSYTVTATSQDGQTGTATIHYTVSQASQSITFTSTPPNNPVFGGTYSVAATGGASGNPVIFSIDPFSALGACSLSGNTVSFTAPGPCIVDANQAGNANYLPAPQAQQSFTIGQASQSISFPSAGVTYGQPDFSPASANSRLPVSYSNPSGPCAIDGQGLVQITGAGSCTISAGQSGNADYQPATPVTQTFTIGQAPLFVNANDASVVFGQTPTLTYTLAGFVNGENGASAGVSGSATCSATPPSQDPGTYPGAINCAPGTLSAANYEFVQGTSGTLTITEASQSISFPPTPVLYNQPDFSPASASSGLPVSYSNPSGQCAIDSQGLVQITGAGSCTITANEPGNTDYQAATSVTQTFAIVGPPTATISSPLDGQIYSQGQSIATSFSCADAANGPGIQSCVDSDGASGGTGALDTSTAGTHNYTVTATSKDGLTGTTTIRYTVTSVTVARLVWSPVPIAPAGGLAPGSLTPVTVTAVDASGTPVRNAAIFLQFSPALSSDAAARCSGTFGGTVISAAGVYCRANGSGVVTVMYRTSSGSALPDGSDTLVAAIDPYGTDRAADSYTYLAPARSRIARFAWSPSPIAATGSLAPDQQVTVTLTALDRFGSPIPNVPVQIALQLAPGSTAAITVAGHILPSGQLGTRADGTITVTYRASGNPTTGTDAITATDSTGLVTQHDLYTY